MCHQMIDSRLPQRPKGVRSGFTLIELLIVIAIIIILASSTRAIGLSVKTNAGIRSSRRYFSNNC